MIIVDSDILIWILRGRSDIRDKFIELSSIVDNQLCITPIQISEIFAGMKEKEKINAALFIDSMPCISIDDKLGRIAGEYLHVYHKSLGVTLADAFIGACVKNFSLKLWTLNKKHYPMLQPDDFLS